MGGVEEAAVVRNLRREQGGCPFSKASGFRKWQDGSEASRHPLLSL